MLAHTVVLLKLICQLNLKCSTYQLIHFFQIFVRTLLSSRNKLSKHVLPKFATIFYIDQAFNKRMATLAPLAEQETRVETRNAMAAAFKDMQAYMPRCFDMEDILM
ncbi:hypothetical protein ElyMa_006177500 [Elysia marginata]|uniref:Uncharacterized protein n=1 Tax=Elysia marginata TaxID=1093978 RepID=A0AAV4H0G8_9GAST|nr:hypothetical protein ElyMa_006177500 [Elysia marginata]